MKQSTRSHTARKAHTCDRCGQPIEAGQRYFRVTELETGHVEVVKIHHPTEPCGTKKKRSRRREAIASLGRGWQPSTSSTE